MTYSETLEYLYSSLPAYQRIGKAAYKADLETTYALDKYFGHPHIHYKTVHVAGTNGKGSVSHFLASVLAEEGYKVGLYTSPHLLDFRERIRVNGSMITEDYVVDFVEQHSKFFEEIKPSFFEMTVAMAFQYFRDMDVDIAVIETGMGGRLDSTNIITPLVSVITNISLDHTTFLGTTKKKIAGEKAGIIKKGVPVVIGRTEDETVEVFRNTAINSGSHITFADKKYSINKVETRELSNLTVNVAVESIPMFDRLESGLAGVCQIENIASSIAVLDILRENMTLSDRAIRDGFSKVVFNTGIVGRWQLIGMDPLVICDTAHNLDGLKGVMNQLLEVSSRKLRFIIGFVNDKNIDQIINIFPQSAEYYITRASIPRSLPVDDLFDLASGAGLSCKKYDAVGDAYSAALGDADAEDTIFVGGSTFIVADFLQSVK